MNLFNQLIAHRFVASVGELLKGGAGDFAVVSKFRYRNFKVIDELFEPVNDVHL